MSQTEDRLAELDMAKIYDELRRRKAAGEVFDWSTITRDELQTLSWDYNLMDAWIGEL